MKALVTGAAGFVGRHMTQRLLQEGFEVCAVDNLRPLTGAIEPDAWPLFDPREHAGFSFERQDCRAWFAAHPKAEFDYVFHLAAMVGGRQMIERQPLAVADDLSIDAAFWQWAAEAQPGQCVSFSSSAAYPISRQRSVGYELLREDMISFEDDLGMPDMSYGWAKLTSEYLGRLAYEKHGVKSVCFRPFSGYGEDQDGAYPFPSICKRVLAHQGADEIVVWGSGRQMRDFIHIDDCVEGIFHMKDAAIDGSAVNLSTGRFTSFIELATIAAGAAGYQPAVRGLASEPEGVFARGGDTAKQKSLGFEASISLEQGVARAVAFFAERPELWRSEHAR